jgi:hypothetical protein
MTSRDDRFLEMLTDGQVDKAIELMLRGLVVEPDLEPVARFTNEAGALADNSPPPRSPELAAILAGEPLDDDTLSVGAARAVAIARSSLPVGGASSRSGGRGVMARASARVAAMSLAAKAGLGLALAGAGAAGAGATGVLPDPIVDAVRHTIEVVTPFELPDQASAEAATGVDIDLETPTEAGDSSPVGSDEDEPAVGQQAGSNAGTEWPLVASATPRPGGGTGATSPSEGSSPLVDPAEMAPALDDTPAPPANPPGQQQAAPDPAGAPSSGGPPSHAGGGNPNPGGPPSQAGDANASSGVSPNEAGKPDPNPGGPPSQAGNANAGGPSSQPGSVYADGPPPGKVAGRPGDPSSSHGSDLAADGPPPVQAGHTTPGRSPGGANAPSPGAGGPPSVPTASSSTTHGRPSAAGRPRDQGGSTPCSAAPGPDGP